MKINWIKTFKFTNIKIFKVVMKSKLTLFTVPRSYFTPKQNSNNYILRIVCIDIILKKLRTFLYANLVYSVLWNAWTKLFSWKFIYSKLFKQTQSWLYRENTRWVRFSTQREADSNQWLWNLASLFNWIRAFYKSAMFYS